MLAAMDLSAHLIGIGRQSLELAAIAVWFFLLAFVVKRDRALSDARAAAGQIRINLVLTAVDMALVAPLVALIITAAVGQMQRLGLTAPSGPLWRALGPIGTGGVVSVLADFAGYWRHRLQHTALLWPAHAVHHSDTHLTWFSLGRMHPIDRLGTMLDVLVLAALGCPVWAITTAVLARSYYGYLVHADLPWTFGRLALVFNPPAAHRWHHARDIEGSGVNFATLFSVFDRAFGTWRLPGPCDAPLGVAEDMGRGALGQYLHPLRTWAAAIAAQSRSRSQATNGASAGGIG